MSDPILVAESKEQIFLLPKMANRHGLIAGATGTGKTVTLQTLAENFSARGVPVFMADVKGDLAGLSQAGGDNPKIVERVKELSLADFKGEACPVVFLDVFGEQGHPVRATVSEMGPLLLGRLLELNNTQESVLNMVFKIADENGLLQPTIGPRGAVHDSLATSMAKSAMRAASSQIGRQVVRGILGGILGGSTRRR